MHKSYKNYFICLTLVLTASVFLSGCEPLRKKFTREKKKTQKEEFIPVLDPIDYPAARVSSSEKYEYHFSLWQVWSKDLRYLMKESGMDKRKRYLLSQVVGQLTELKQWTPENFSETLDTAIQQYDKVQNDLDKPETMRSDNVIESRLRQAESFIRNSLDPDLVFEEKL